MTMEYRAGANRTLWGSKPAEIRHRTELEAVCWFVTLGLALTLLLYALGCADSIGQALATSG